MKTTPDPTTSGTARPRILLAEDCPTSLAFLTAALQALPADVYAAASMAAALELATLRRYDLWLFDAHLPDGSGTELLARVDRLQPGVAAMAHTASNDADTRDLLLAAGFRAVLVKPMPAAAVRAAVRAMVDSGNPVQAQRPLWDDDSAAAALNGNTAHVGALRQLFLAELPQAREKILASARNDNPEAVRGELHKLQASCGFVGAAHLAEAVRALQRQVHAPEALHRFDRAVSDTMEHRADTVAELA